MHLLNVAKQGKYQDPARELAKQRVVAASPMHWGSLAPLSPNAKDRSEGANVIFDAAEHILGRLVASAAYAFDHISVSARHCRVVRRLTDSAEIAAPSVFVTDTSSNGTWINGRRLEKNGPEVLLNHGDVMSLVGPPEAELAWVYVYLEVEGAPLHSEPALPPPANGAAVQHLKRKITSADGVVVEESHDSKRGRAAGNGSMQGPLSLADFKGMQRANEELRKQLEEQAQHIDTLTAAQRSTQARHDAELKDATSAVEAVWRGRVDGLELVVATSSRREADLSLEVSQLASEVADLKQRMASAAQSRADAEAAIVSLRGTLEEAVERAKEARAALDKVREEAEKEKHSALARERAKWQEEHARLEEAKVIQLRQLKEQLNAAQESEREQRKFAEDLRTKLEGLRNEHVDLQEQHRKLGAQLEEERAGTKRALEAANSLEKRLRDAEEGRGTQQAARENADQRIQQLEASMETSQRALELERQRVQGARERVMLRETQLRAFHATAAEIAELQKTQQEQLNTLMSVLKDEDDYDEGEGGAKGDGGSRRGTPTAIAVRSFPRPPSSLLGSGNPKANGGSSYGHANGSAQLDGMGYESPMPLPGGLHPSKGAPSGPLSQEFMRTPPGSHPEAREAEPRVPEGALADMEEGDTQEEGGGGQQAGSETEDQGLCGALGEAADDITSKQHEGDAGTAAPHPSQAEHCATQPGTDRQRPIGEEDANPAVEETEAARALAATGAVRCPVPGNWMHSTLAIGEETLPVVEEEDEGALADAGGAQETMRMEVDPCQEPSGPGRQTPPAAMSPGGVAGEGGAEPGVSPSHGHLEGLPSQRSLKVGEVLHFSAGPSTQQVPALPAPEAPAPTDDRPVAPAPPKSPAVSADLIASELPGTWAEESAAFSGDAQADLESPPGPSQPEERVGSQAGGLRPEAGGSLSGAAQVSSERNGEPQGVLGEGGLAAKESHALGAGRLSSLLAGQGADSAEWSQQSDSNTRLGTSPRSKASNGGGNLPQQSASLGEYTPAVD